MLTKIETLSGCQVKSSGTLVWEKAELPLTNYRTVQIVLTTNSTGSIKVQVMGFDEERTLEKVLIDKTVKAKGGSHIFTINTDEFAHDGINNCDIRVTAAANTTFSVLTFSSNPRYTENEEDIESGEGTDEDFDDDEVEDGIELVDYTFNLNTVTKCTQHGGAIKIPSSYSKIDGKFYTGKDYTVTTIGSGILNQAVNYTELIIPDSVIIYPTYGFASTLSTTCKKIKTGNGFGKTPFEAYPLGHTNFCEEIECGTGLKLVAPYIFGTDNTTIHTLKFATIEPPTLTDQIVLTQLSALKTILVPQAGLEDWKTATNWTKFATKINGY